MRGARLIDGAPATSVIIPVVATTDGQGGQMALAGRYRRRPRLKKKRVLWTIKRVEKRKGKSSLILPFASAVVEILNE